MSQDMFSTISADVINSNAQSKVYQKMINSFWNTDEKQALVESNTLTKGLEADGHQKALVRLDDGDSGFYSIDNGKSWREFRMFSPSNELDTVDYQKDVLNSRNKTRRQPQYVANMVGKSVQDLTEQDYANVEAFHAEETYRAATDKNYTPRKYDNNTIYSKDVLSQPIEVMLKSRGSDYYGRDLVSAINPNTGKDLGLDLANNAEQNSSFDPFKAVNTSYNRNTVQKANITSNEKRDFYENLQDKDGYFGEAVDLLQASTAKALKSSAQGLEYLGDKAYDTVADAIGSVFGESKTAKRLRDIATQQNQLSWQNDIDATDKLWGVKTSTREEQNKQTQEFHNEVLNAFDNYKDFGSFTKQVGGALLDRVSKGGLHFLADNLGSTAVMLTEAVAATAALSVSAPVAASVGLGGVASFAASHPDLTRAMIGGLSSASMNIPDYVKSYKESHDGKDPSMTDTMLATALFTVSGALDSAIDFSVMKGKTLTNKVFNPITKLAEKFAPGLVNNEGSRSILRTMLSTVLGMAKEGATEFPQEGFDQAIQSILSDSSLDGLSLDEKLKQGWEKHGADIIEAASIGAASGVASGLIIGNRIANTLITGTGAAIGRTAGTTLNTGIIAAEGTTHYLTDKFGITSAESRENKVANKITEYLSGSDYAEFVRASTKAKEAIPQSFDAQTVKDFIDKEYNGNASKALRSFYKDKNGFGVAYEKYVASLSAEEQQATQQQATQNKPPVQDQEVSGVEGESTEEQAIPSVDANGNPIITPTSSNVEGTEEVTTGDSTDLSSVNTEQKDTNTISQDAETGIQNNPSESITEQQAQSQQSPVSVREAVTNFAKGFNESRATNTSTNEHVGNFANTVVNTVRSTIGLSNNSSMQLNVTENDDTNGISVRGTYDKTTGKSTLTINVPKGITSLTDKDTHKLVTELAAKTIHESVAHHGIVKVFSKLGDKSESIFNKMSKAFVQASRNDASLRAYLNPLLKDVYDNNGNIDEDQLELKLRTPAFREQIVHEALAYAISERHLSYDINTGKITFGNKDVSEIRNSDNLLKNTIRYLNKLYKDVITNFYHKFVHRESIDNPYLDLYSNQSFRDFLDTIVANGLTEDNITNTKETSSTKEKSSEESSKPIESELLHGETIEDSTAKSIMKAIEEGGNEGIKKLLSIIHSLKNPKTIKEVLKQVLGKSINGYSTSTEERTHNNVVENPFISLISKLDKAYLVASDKEVTENETDTTLNTTEGKTPTKSETRTHIIRHMLSKLSPEAKEGVKRYLKAFVQSLQNNRTVVTYDIETTSTDPTKADIVQISITKFNCTDKNGVKNKQTLTLTLHNKEGKAKAIPEKFNDGSKNPFYDTYMASIGKTSVSDEEAIAKVQEFLKNDKFTLIGHNSSIYDHPVLSKVFGDKVDFLANNPEFDTFALSLLLNPEADNFKLGSLVDVTNAHNAEGDVEATIRLALDLKEKAKIVLNDKKSILFNGDTSLADISNSKTFGSATWYLNQLDAMLSKTDSAMFGDENELSELREAIQELSSLTNILRDKSSDVASSIINDYEHISSESTQEQSQNTKATEVDAKSNSVLATLKKYFIFGKTLFSPSKLHSEEGQKLLYHVLNDLSMNGGKTLEEVLAETSKNFTSTKEISEAIDKNPEYLILYDKDENGELHLRKDVWKVCAALAVSWVVSGEVSSCFNHPNEDQVKAMFDLQSENDSSVKDATIFIAEHGVPEDMLAVALGRFITGKLGISPNRKTGNMHTQDTLHAIIGSTFIGMLKEAGYIDETKADNKALEFIKSHKSTFTEKLEGYVNNKNNNLTNCKLTFDPSIARSSREESLNEFNNFFNVEVNPIRFPELNPINTPPARFATNTNGFIRIPKFIRNILRHFGKVAYVNNTPVVRSVLDNVESIINAGFIDIKLDEDIAKDDLDTRVSAQGRNQDLIRGLQMLAIEQARQDNDPSFTGFYYHWNVARNFRFFQDGTSTNPMSQKWLTRFVQVPIRSIETFSKANPSSYEKRALLEAFKLVTKDKSTNNERAEKLLNLNKEQINTLYQALLGKDEKGNFVAKGQGAEYFAETSEKILGFELGIENYGLALSALDHLRIRNESTSDSFKSFLRREADSASSGYFIRTMLIPAQKILDRFAKALGIREKGDNSVRELALDKASGDPNSDIYKSIINGIIEKAVPKSATNNKYDGTYASVFSNIYKFIPKSKAGEEISSALREIYKNPIMIFAYGAGLFSFSSKIADAVRADLFKNFKEAVSLGFTIEKTKLGFSITVPSDVNASEEVVNAANLMASILDNSKELQEACITNNGTYDIHELWDYFTKHSTNKIMVTAKAVKWTVDMYGNSVTLTPDGKTTSKENAEAITEDVSFDYFLAESVRRMYGRPVFYQLQNVFKEHVNANVLVSTVFANCQHIYATAYKEALKRAEEEAKKNGKELTMEDRQKLLQQLKPLLPKFKTAASLQKMIDKLYDNEDFKQAYMDKKIKDAGDNAEVEFNEKEYKEYIKNLASSIMEEETSAVILGMSNSNFDVSSMLTMTVQTPNGPKQISINQPTFVTDGRASAVLPIHMIDSIIMARTMVAMKYRLLSVYDAEVGGPKAVSEAAEKYDEAALDLQDYDYLGSVATMLSGILGKISSTDRQDNQNYTFKYTWNGKEETIEFPAIQYSNNNGMNDKSKKGRVINLQNSSERIPTIQTKIDNDPTQRATTTKLTSLEQLLAIAESYANDVNKLRAEFKQKYDTVINQGYGALTSLNSNRSKGVDKSVVESVATKFNAKTANITTNTVQSFNELPETLRMGLVSKYGKEVVNQLEGVYYNGNVYLVADNIISKDRAEEVWLHEVLGHYSFEDLFDEETKNKILDNLYSKLDPKEVSRLANKFELKGNDQETKRQLTREYIAELAQKESLDNNEKSIWSKIYKIIAYNFKKLFNKTSSEEDVKYLLYSMKKNILNPNRSEKFIANNTYTSFRDTAAQATSNIIHSKTVNTVSKAVEETTSPVRKIIQNVLLGADKVVAERANGFFKRFRDLITIEPNLTDDRFKELLNELDQAIEDSKKTPGKVSLKSWKTLFKLWLTLPRTNKQRIKLCNEFKFYMQRCISDKLGEKFRSFAIEFEREFLTRDKVTRDIIEGFLAKKKNIETLVSHMIDLDKKDNEQLFRKKDGSVLTKDERLALAKTVLMTNLSSLLSGNSKSSNIDEILEYLKTPDTRYKKEKELIAEIQQIIGNDTVSNKFVEALGRYSDVLADYMVTRKSNILCNANTNAQTIIDNVLFALGKSSINEADNNLIADKLEQIITLKAISKTDPKALDTISNLNVPDLALSMDSFLDQAQQYKRKIKGMQGIRQGSGYIKINPDRYLATAIDSTSGRSSRLHDGFELVKENMEVIPRVVSFSYYKKDWATPSHLDGSTLSFTDEDLVNQNLFNTQFTDNERDGIRTYGDHLFNNTMRDCIIGSNTMPKKCYTCIVRENKNGSPVFSIAPMSYADSEKLENLEIDAFDSLARMKASVESKDRGKKLNSDILSKLKELADKATIDPKTGFDETGHRWILIHPDFKKTEDAFKELPKEIRDEFKNMDLVEQLQNGVWIREDWITDIFGAKSFSLADVEALKFDPKFNKFIRIMEHSAMAVASVTKQNIILFGTKVIRNNIVSNVLYHSLTHGIDPITAGILETKTIPVIREYEKLVQERDKIKRLINQYSDEYKSRTNDTRFKNLNTKLTKLNDAIDKDDKFATIRVLVDNGMFANIAEDLSYADMESTGLAQRGINKVADKLGVSKHVRSAVKQAFFVPGTPTYKFMYKATQYSDFCARIVEYNLLHEELDKNIDKEYAAYLKSDIKDKMSKKEFRKSREQDIITEVKNAFVNYDKPHASKLQYLNNIGLVMFTKYRFRIQKVIWSCFKKHPVSALIAKGAQYYFGDVEDVYDGEIISKLITNPTANLYNMGSNAIEAVTPPFTHYVFGWKKLW